MEDFKLKTNIFFGEGSLKRLSELQYNKVFIVTDPFMVESGAINKIVDKFKKEDMDLSIFSDVVPDPPIENIIKGVKVMIEFDPDVVVALGGGSAIDTAKAICLFKNKVSNQLANNINKKNVKFIAIPTTSGTGSEVTNFSVITDRKKGVKYPLISDELLADEAILDAELVKTVPDFITADTGMDVLTHAIEAYVSLKSTDYTDALAEKSIKMVFENLISAYNHGDNMEARRKMHNASCMAGIAFNSASLGINHGIAHTIGGRFHLSHGKTNAILLPYVIEFNANMKNNSIYNYSDSSDSNTAKKYAQIASILGLPCPTVRQGVKNLISAIRKLLKDLKIPNSFKEAGLDKKEFYDELTILSQRSIDDRCSSTNPRSLNIEEVIELLKKTYNGK
ncbi:1-propanol dehydrogenase PduQ [Clostridium scatologenes]|uniref:NADPH-dependent butanol dehydrogenase n=1 Tax=Clostridium scatologenes TaxID=1548 RepID=A0A0E3JN16_CLOSL|nr:1-propanol dehydrogenase PduQ [Clostridium scatologenes]AKA68754.1 NADPH-dependent butanol dehydrogenase [Clostridium scatologenes]